MRVRIIGTLTVLLGAGIPAGYAQYREEPARRAVEVQFVSGGYLQQNLRPRHSNALPDSAVISYDRLMPVLGLRQGVLDLLVGYARFSLRGRSRETILASAIFRQELPLGRTGKDGLSVPILLSTGFFRAQAAGPERTTLNVATVGVGLGVRGGFAGPASELWIEALGAVHYAVDGIGTGSGFSPVLAAEAGAFFPGALTFASLAAGYRVRLQSWSMSDSAYDYRLSSHGAYLGVWF